jgi:hypothetical protein
MFGSVRGKVKGEWKQLILKKYNFYSSWNNIRTITPERMKWVGHTEHMDIWKCIHDTLWKTSGKRSREIDADGKIILKWISTKDRSWR